MPKVQKLKNGLTYIAIEKPASETAAVLLLVKVGSVYEQAKIFGAAHMAEHLVFKATKCFKNTQEITEFMDEIGGAYNAFTGKEMTGFHAVVEKAYLDRALKFVLELVDEPKLKEADFETEKKIIIEEIKLHEDIPSHLAGDLFYQAMFPDQPVAHNIAGTRQSVKNFEHRDLKNFFKQHYRAENMMLLVATDKETLSRIKLASFQQIGSSGITQISPISKAGLTSNRLIIANKEIEQANFILGFLGPSYGSPNRLILSLLVAILGGMMSSRMFLEVRERQELCYNIRSEIDFCENFSLQTTEAGVKVENLYRALGAVLAEYQKIKSKGVSNSELQKGKDNMKGRLAIGLDNSEALVEFYGRQWLLSGGLKSPKQIKKEIESVTQTDILRVANKYFTPETLSVSIVSPKVDKAKVVVELDRFS